MRNETRDCTICRKPLTGKQQLYCSKECRLAKRYERARVPKTVGVCDICGNEFEGTKNKKHCSIACARIAVNRNSTLARMTELPEQQTHCLVCNKLIEGDGLLYCSKSCCYLATRQRRKERLRIPDKEEQQ